MSEPKKRRTAAQVMAALKVFADYRTAWIYPEAVQEDLTFLGGLLSEQKAGSMGLKAAEIAYLNSVEIVGEGEEEGESECQKG